MINQRWIHVIWRWFPCFKHGICSHEWNWDDLRISDIAICLGCWNQDATDLRICDKHRVGPVGQDLSQDFSDILRPSWTQLAALHSWGCPNMSYQILPVSLHWGSARWPTGTGTWHHRPTRQLAVVLSTYGFFSHGFLNEAYTTYIRLYQGFSQDS